jgi:hypothetical protein
VTLTLERKTFTTANDLVSLYPEGGGCLQARTGTGKTDKVFLTV